MRLPENIRVALSVYCIDSIWSNDVKFQALSNNWAVVICILDDGGNVMMLVSKILQKKISRNNSTKDSLISVTYDI